MLGYEETCNYNMPLTIEKHFEQLAQCYPSVKELHSLWILLKKHIEDELLQSRNIFVNYSLHDGSHSRSILQAIERFLSEERIRKLSATDTFMLLICAYAHDYGMAKAFNKVYDILESDEFSSFLEETDKNQLALDKEEAWAVHNLATHLKESRPNHSLKDLYFSIMLVIQLYLRPPHWKGVADIENDFQGLFQGYIKNRFIRGSEGVVEICMCHGQSFDAILKLSVRADGMVGDEFHPRFIAAMLRLGDLLDLDNGRFPLWFVREIAQNRNLIPKLSILHFRKHEAISHLLITHKLIEITAECSSKQDGFEVANLVREWTEWLEEESKELVLHWNEIAQPDFGRPPSNLKFQIFVDGKPYTSLNKKMQMQMSQERVMKLLEGTSIYQDKYVGIREMLQNAVDATLLQLWNDIIQNRYISYGLSKHTAKTGLDLQELTEDDRNSIFGNYDITMEVIQDKKEGQVFVVIKDKGIGIIPDDVDYISNIGSSKENNVRTRKIMEGMPKWLKPAGVFGIGLQSVFQLTDCIEFYTRQHNEPERLIMLNSYGKNRGKIETREIPPNEDGLYNDNAVPGTNVKIAIEPRKLLYNMEGGPERNHFIYYDSEFDKGEELDMLFAELCKACQDKIKNTKCDFFNINYQSVRINGDGNITKEKKKKLRSSYFYMGKKGDDSQFIKLMFGDTIQPLFQSKGSPYSFIDNMAYYWDKTTNRSYCLTIRPCRIVTQDNKKQVYLPEPVSNLYHISYKFNTISNAETIYSLSNRSNDSSRLHAGFLSWDILILDDQPTKYLNIDRDRLREGAIHETELVDVRTDIMEKWCEFFLPKDSAKDGKIKPEFKRFEKPPEILLSIILQFYQCVSSQQFERFVEPYQKFIESMELIVGNEKIPITHLLDPSKLFRSSFEIPRKFMYLSCEEETKEAIQIAPETVRYLPHRLVNIEKIYSNRDANLLYHFYLHAPGNDVQAISMSPAARLYDYMKAMEPYTNQPTRVDYASLQKKVFKPNSQFRHLLLSCYPHTFRKGGNFESTLDHCIRGYILSPFDRISTNILKRGIEKDENVMVEFRDTVMNSSWMDKCIQYILNKREIETGGKVKAETDIRKEYSDFISDFYSLLFENKEMVCEQFEQRKNVRYFS